MTVLTWGRTAALSNVPSDLRNENSYISVEHTALLEYLRFVVVINTESLEQDLVLICRYGARKFLLGGPVVKSTLQNKGPESRIIQIVYVACAK